MKRRMFALFALLATLSLLSHAHSSAQSGRARESASPKRTAPATAQAGSDEVPEFSATGSATTSTSSPAPGASSTGIAWKSSLDDARNSARQGQIIVVDVYTDWCGWCKYMDKNIYADASVIRFAADHVFVKVNAEDGGSGEALARRNMVTGFPTTLVFSSTGKLLDRRAGAFRKPADFVAWLSRIAG